MVLLKSGPESRRLRIGLVLGLVSILLHLVGVRRGVRLVWRLAQIFPAPTPADPMRRAYTMASHIAAVAKAMPAGCLVQSVLLAGNLRRHGMAAQLCVGVSAGGPFAAHAWVELNGSPLNDSDDVACRYKPIWRTESTATIAAPQ